MNKFFVKNGELALVNGGYLVIKKTETPVFNEDFVAVQKHAEWVVTFAEKAKGKDFIGKQADSIADVKAEVLKVLSNSTVEYVKAPKEVKRELTDKLQEEALAFIKFHGETSKTEKINKFLQQFNTLNDFENFGLYFDDSQIVKLNKIYSMKDIINSVTQIIDLVD